MLEQTTRQMTTMAEATEPTTFEACAYPFLPGPVALATVILGFASSGFVWAWIEGDLGVASMCVGLAVVTTLDLRRRYTTRHTPEFSVRCTATSICAGFTGKETTVRFADCDRVFFTGVDSDRIVFMRRDGTRFDIVSGSLYPEDVERLLAFLKSGPLPFEDRTT